MFLLVVQLQVESGTILPELWQKSQTEKAKNKETNAVSFLIFFLNLIAKKTANSHFAECQHGKLGGGNSPRPDRPLVHLRVHPIPELFLPKLLVFFSLFNSNIIITFISADIWGKSAKSSAQVTARRLRRGVLKAPSGSTGPTKLRQT